MSADPTAAATPESFSWMTGWDQVLVDEPDLRDAYGRLAAATTGALDPETRELILLAVNASPTHLVTDQVRRHIDAALDAGATEAAIVEVLALVAILGMHSCTVGVPIVAGALASQGRVVAAEPLTAAGTEVVESHALQGEYWQQFERDIPDFLPTMLRLDPAWLSAFLTLSGLPWKSGALSPKVKELVYFAIDVSTTHLHEPGAKLHARNALAFGATAAELVEVAELASTIGAQSLAIGLPLLRDALAARA